MTLELNKNLSCTLDNCAILGFLGNEQTPATFFGSASTGIIESFDIKNEAGQVVGHTQSILVVTRDSNGNPRLARTIAQVETASEPDVNILEYVVSSLDKTYRPGNVLYSNDELAKLVPKGTGLKFFVDYQFRKVNKNNGSVFLQQNLFTYTQPGSFQALVDFAQSGAVKYNFTNPPLFFGKGLDLN